MKQVEIFESFVGLITLESSLNTWLASNQQHEIIDIKFTSVDSENFFVHTAMIIYETNT